MPFPTSKKSKLELELSDPSNVQVGSIRNTIFDRLGHAEVEKLRLEKDKVLFSTRNSMFRVPYEISLDFHVKSELTINYEIRLSELLKLCVLVAIILAFFSRMQVEYFVLLFILTISSFYGLNIFIVENGLKNLLRDVFDKTPYAAKTTNESEQETWMNDPSRCPACGEFLYESFVKCPSCKLSLPKRKQHKLYKPYTGESTSPEIHYNYKEKKK